MSSSIGGMAIVEGGSIRGVVEERTTLERVDPDMDEEEVNTGALSLVMEGEEAVGTEMEKMGMVMEEVEENMEEM